MWSFIRRPKPEADSYRPVASNGEIYRVARDVTNPATVPSEESLISGPTESNAGWRSRVAEKQRARAARRIRLNEEYRASVAETERLKVEAALGIARRIPLNTFDQLAADTLRLHILEPRLVDFAWAHFRERQRAGLPLVGTPIDTSRGFRRPPAGPSHALYAEHYVAARLGGSVTQFSGDRGIDVLAPGWAVQVKNTTSPAGRPVVQNIYGAAATFGKPAVWSNSGFTKSAEEEARRLGVTLWNF